MLTDTEKYLVVKEAIKRGGVAVTIAACLTDDFWKKYVKEETRYLLALSPKDTWIYLFGKDKYSDYVNSCGVSVGDDGIIRLTFTLKIHDKDFGVFGTANKIFAVSVEDVPKYRHIFKTDRNLKILL